MRIKSRVPFDVVIQAWLRAEWSLSNFDTIRDKVPEQLINSENFDNQQDNQSRLNILRALRSPMIDPLPSDTEWYSASYDKEDIQRTFIVPSEDWGTISHKNYHPSPVMNNLHFDDGHAKKINSIKTSLSQKTIDRRLILVGTAINSLLTIIEGNHRAVAIFKMIFI